MTSPSPIPGSFRDPSGQVFVFNDRVYRTVMPVAREDFEFVRSSGLIRKLIDTNMLIDEQIASDEIAARVCKEAALVLEHPKLAFVSFPYEWSFQTLKCAALLHLDIQIEALKHDVSLSDASAYNIQFIGSQPVFIDALSFRRYTEGEYWFGHKQFCEQFLNPLLLRALLGQTHNSWYRGNLEGISGSELAAVLKPWHKLSPNVLAHVVMPAKLQNSAQKQGSSIETVKTRTLPKKAYGHLLQGLRNWINKLQPADKTKTAWTDYAVGNSYSSVEAKDKHATVETFAREVSPGLLFDIGCNTGEYSQTALTAGARSVIGFDFDRTVLDAAFSRAQQEHLNFLPLFLDAANPSPSQGWLQAERPGFNERARGDAVLALAVVHHLAIARNIPLAQVIEWLVSLAPNGIIEFVPKDDPMVRELLKLRKDIFEDYSRENFVSALRARAAIENSSVVSQSGRELFRFKVA